MADDHLSPSQLGTISKCLYRRYLSKVMGYREPPGVAMYRGKGTHKGVEANMRHKIDVGELLPLDSVTDATRDAVNEAFFEEPPLLFDDDLAQGMKKTQGDTVDAAVRLGTLHHEVCAPAILPTHCERGFTLSIPGSTRNLIGFIDLEEADSIHDTKTAAKTPSKGTAHSSLQLTCYAMARHAEGNPVAKVQLDTLVDLKSGAKENIQESSRGPVDFAPLVKRIQVVDATLNAGNFPPTDPSNWWCSKKWCGFYTDICPHGRRGRTVG